MATLSERLQQSDMTGLDAAQVVAALNAPDPSLLVSRDCGTGGAIRRACHTANRGGARGDTGRPNTEQHGYFIINASNCRHIDNA
jgi:hypothetical protein